MYRGIDFPWHIQSVRGECRPGGTTVELIDAVRVARTDEKNRTDHHHHQSHDRIPAEAICADRQAVRIDGAYGVTTARV